MYKSIIRPGFSSAQKIKLRENNLKQREVNESSYHKYQDVSRSTMEKHSNQNHLKEFLDNLKKEEKCKKKINSKLDKNSNHQTDFLTTSNRKNNQIQNTHSKFYSSNETKNNISNIKRIPKNSNSIHKELSNLQSTIDNLEKKLCKYITPY